MTPDGVLREIPSLKPVSVHEGASQAAWLDDIPVQLLDQARLHHEQGDRLVVLFALEVCAISRTPMPPWLAELVAKAIRTAFIHGTDEVLGIGSPTMRNALRGAAREQRNLGIRETFKLRRKGRGALKSRLAELYPLSEKAIEAIVYPVKPQPRGWKFIVEPKEVDPHKSPTFRTKK